MEKYLPILLQSPLFFQIEEENLLSMLHCLSATYKTFSKGSFIFQQHKDMRLVGMVLSGSVHIIKEDFWGNRTILTEISTGALFGETLAFTKKSNIDIAVLASKDTEILFFNIEKIITVCSSACTFHTRLIKNLLTVFAEKNLMLTKKMEHLAKRNTKEKLLSYLSAEALKNETNTFTIPFNRQQLADYLCVDRSAMSNELCKLRDEGILTFQKNKFSLSQKDI